MHDLTDRLRQVEDNDSPDLWDEIVARSEEAPPSRGGRSRIAAGLVAAIIAVLGLGLLFLALTRSDDTPASETPPPIEIRVWWTTDPYDMHITATYQGQEIELDAIETPGSELEYPAGTPATIPVGAPIAIDAPGAVVSVFQLQPATGEFVEDGSCIVPGALRMLPGPGETAFFIYIEGPDSSGGMAFRAEMEGETLEQTDAIDVGSTVVAEELGLAVCAPTGSSQPPTGSSTPPREDIAVDVPQPGYMAAAFGSIWVQSRSDGSIWRIEPEGDVTARIEGGSAEGEPEPYLGAAGGVAEGFGYVWSLTSDSLVRIDPSSNEITATVPIEFPSELAVGEGAVWLVCCRSSVRLVKVDPATLSSHVVANLGTSVASLGVGGGSVWWLRFSEGGGMYKIDPVTSEVVELQTGYNQQFIVSTDRWIWLVGDGSTLKMDFAGESHGSLKPVARTAIGASYADGTVWINDGSAVGFDAETGEVTTVLPGFGEAKWWWSGGIARLGDRVWLANPKDDQVLGLPLA
jgi:hypothetical protein